MDDSSPSSRTTDSFASPHRNNGSKLRFMCSSGGHIVPRPHDKSLCYVGGDTRIVIVDRHTTLSNLTTRLTKTVIRSSTSSATKSYTIKYQLPSEDLDLLISVTTDEDLENMIDEYDRLKVNVASRIRLFLFPDKPEPVLKTVMSEEWFVNALNGTTSDNCLLSLEDDVEVPEEKKEESNKYVKLLQDVLSVPDSLMLETTSSLFGSASSTPVKYDEDVSFLQTMGLNCNDGKQPVTYQHPVTHAAVPSPQYLHHHHPMPCFYPIYPTQTQYSAPYPALGQHNLVYYMPAGALAPQLVHAPSRQQQIQPQFVGYSHMIHQHVAQPLPQSAAQYQLL